MRILGREPAAWVALATIIVQGIGAFWAGFSVDMQSWVIAAIAAGLNLIVAIVTHDGVIAAISGFVQGVVSLAVGLGANMTTHQQFYVMAVIVAIAQWFTRQNVTAPVPADAFRKLPIAPAPPAAPTAVPTQ